MEKRLKVLMSAYACEPNRGSEPEVGWRWALEMSKDHDITVVTRANNREPIERGLSSPSNSHQCPRFHYCDLNEAALKWKKRLGATGLYYWLWQREARREIASLVAKEHFDLLHHTTFAGFRYPIAILGHGVPTLWGPIGGVEQNPWRLLPWSHPPSCLEEVLRNVLNNIQTSPWSSLRTKASSVTKVAASTPAMQQTLQAMGCPSPLLPTIGLDAHMFSARREGSKSGSLRLLYVGNIISWKGPDLAIEALKVSETDAVLTLIGEGTFKRTCQRLVTTLGLEDRVHFVGRRSHAEVLGGYKHFDVLLFPSMHDTGGYVVLEALANGLPVICLDSGGPGLAVQDDCGIKVPPGGRHETVLALAKAIRLYSDQRELLEVQAPLAKRIIVEKYDWQMKRRLMLDLYAQVVGAKPHVA